MAKKNEEVIFVSKKGHVIVLEKKFNFNKNEKKKVKKENKENK